MEYKSLENKKMGLALNKLHNNNNNYNNSLILSKKIQQYKIKFNRHNKIKILNNNNNLYSSNRIFSLRMGSKTYKITMCSSIMATLMLYIIMEMVL